MSMTRWTCPTCGAWIETFVRLTTPPTCACPTRPGRRVTEMVEDEDDE